MQNDKMSFKTQQTRQSVSKTTAFIKWYAY